MTETTRDEECPAGETRARREDDPANEPPRARLILSDDPLQRPRIIIGRRRT